MQPIPSGVTIDGQGVREKRQLKGLSMTDFAAKARISRQYLSQIETGGRLTCSPPAFARICDALGIPEDGRSQMIRRRVAA